MFTPHLAFLTVVQVSQEIAGGGLVGTLIDSRSVHVLKSGNALAAGANANEVAASPATNTPANAVALSLVSAIYLIFANPLYAVPVSFSSSAAVVGTACLPHPSSGGSRRRPRSPAVRAGPLRATPTGTAAGSGGQQEARSGRGAKPR